MWRMDPLLETGLAGCTKASDLGPWSKKFNQSFSWCLAFAASLKARMQSFVTLFSLSLTEFAQTGSSTWEKAASVLLVLTSKTASRTVAYPSGTSVVKNSHVAEQVLEWLYFKMQFCLLVEYCPVGKTEEGKITQMLPYFQGLHLSWQLFLGFSLTFGPFLR